MTNIAIAAVFLSLGNLPTIQTHPHATNGVYYTNTGTQTIYPANGGWAMHDFVVNHCVRLSWGYTGRTIIQQSTNLSQWQDIRVVFTTPNSWLVSPTERAQFFRLKVQ